MREEMIMKPSGEEEEMKNYICGRTMCVVVRENWSVYIVLLILYVNGNIYSTRIIYLIYFECT